MLEFFQLVSPCRASRAKLFFLMNNPLKNPLLIMGIVKFMNSCACPDSNSLRRPLLSLCSVACSGILAFLPINETDTGQTLDISLLTWNFASKTLGNFSKVKELHSHLIWFIRPIWNYLIFSNLVIDKKYFQYFLTCLHFLSRIPIMGVTVICMYLTLT